MPSLPRQHHPPESGESRSRFLAPSLARLPGEPHRLFFASGVVWGIVGVALWPLFYAGLVGFAPPLVHARLMVESFGGAFVVGFLGTAGPRLADAPELTAGELLWLLGLHQAASVLHLTLHPAAGDACFLVLVASLLLGLVLRFTRLRREAPPPQILLALAGLVCGLVGAGLHATGSSLRDPQLHRFSNLLLYQGFLLAPVLGVGSYLFPRLRGGDFGESRSASDARKRGLRALGAAGLLVASFALEAWGGVGIGYGLRLATAASYLLLEVDWSRRKAGSLTAGLISALSLGGLGLALAPFPYHQHVSIEHLLYVGGFGLLILVVGSRVLFGHAGSPEDFFARSWWARFVVALAVLAATTRAVPAWAPSTTISHHVYAALTWVLLLGLWLVWHRRRFRDGE